MNKYLKWSLIGTGVVAAVGIAYTMFFRKKGSAMIGVTTPTSTNWTSSLKPIGLDAYLQNLTTQSGVKVTEQMLTTQVIGDFPIAKVEQRLRDLGFSGQQLEDLIQIGRLKYDYLKGRTFVGTIQGILVSARVTVLPTTLTEPAIQKNVSMGN